MTPAARCETLLKKMQAAYPDVGISFGYVGNCGIGYDDRSWYFFTKVINPKGYYQGGTFQFGDGVRTPNLDKLADQAEAGLETWLREKVQPHAADRYRTYHIKGHNIRFQRPRLQEEYGFSYGMDAQHEAIIGVRGMAPEQVAKALPGVETFECDAGGHPLNRQTA